MYQISLRLKFTVLIDIFYSIITALLESDRKAGECKEIYFTTNQP